MEQRGLDNVVEDLLRRSKNVASSKSPFVSLIEVRQEFDKGSIGIKFKKTPDERREGYGFDHSTYPKGGSTLNKKKMKMKKMDKKKMKGPVERYMELRQGVKKFSFYKKFNPSEPHDPLGNLYNGIFTAATQTLFRKKELASSEIVQLLIFVFKLLSKIS